jgi:hypothetical protein
MNTDDYNAYFCSSISSHKRRWRRKERSWNFRTSLAELRALESDFSKVIAKFRIFIKFHKVIN